MNIYLRLQRSKRPASPPQPTREAAPLIVATHVVSKPGAALHVERLELSAEARRMLSCNVRSIG